MCGMRWKTERYYLLLVAEVDELPSGVAFMAIQDQQPPYSGGPRPCEWFEALSNPLKSKLVISPSLFTDSYMSVLWKLDIIPVRRCCFPLKKNHGGKTSPAPEIQPTTVAHCLLPG
jgi:hypothetical protein